MLKNVEKFGINDKRGRVRTSEDPYLPAEGLKENTICTDCHAIYRGKHWLLDEKSFAGLEQNPRTLRVSCPACQKVADRYPEGIVTLTGGYLWEHEQEIRNILSNEEKKAFAKNPMERIIRMDRSGDAMVIETTEEKLAEHLGRALHRAHQGKLDITWGREQGVCRVSWQRMN